MIGSADQGGEIAGYSVPVHRALTEQILLGGALTIGGVLLVAIAERRFKAMA